MKYLNKLSILIAVSLALVTANVVFAPQASVAVTLNSTNTSSNSSSGSSGAFSSAKSSACSGISAIDNSQGCQTNGSAVQGLFATTVNVLSLVVGVVAVIMLIVSGIRFVTAGGNSNSVSAAKSTLIYAIVGIVIVALAQIIVRWVIGTTTNITGAVLVHVIDFL